MPTGGLNVFGEKLFYIGAAKQSAWGTAVAPTWFWRWLDGTDANADAKVTKEREGDTSPYISLVYKDAQYWTLKVVEYARPIMAGYALQALLGSGSDTYTAPTKSGTLSAAVNVGDTSFTTALDLGNTGTLPLNVTPGYSSTTYEVVTVDCTSKSGTGPFTYSLATGGKFRNAHLSADPITTKSSHVFTRQLVGYDPYSIEVAFGNANTAIRQATRVQDCICSQLVITSQAKKPVKFESTWWGAPGLIQSSLASPVYEGAGADGAPSGPFRHNMGLGNWQIDGAGTGNATQIATFKLTLKNSTSAEDLLSEGLYPTYYIPGNIDIDAQLDVKFNSYQQYYETYYNTTAAPSANATDAYLVGTGSALALYTMDAVNSLQFSLPNLAYTAAKLTPKLDNKPLTQSIMASAVRTAAVTNPLVVTLANSQNSAY